MTLFRALVVWTVGAALVACSSYRQPAEGGYPYDEEPVPFSASGDCARQLNACADACEDAPENQLCSEHICRQ